MAVIADNETGHFGKNGIVRLCGQQSVIAKCLRNSLRQPGQLPWLPGGLLHLSRHGLATRCGATVGTAATVRSHCEPTSYHSCQRGRRDFL